MNTNIEVLWRLDELVEAARLLGATQAKKLFGEHTEGDRRFERAMYESIDKHRAALLDWEAKQPAPQQPAAVDGAMVERACDAYVQIADDCMGLVRRKAMAAALTAALAAQRQEPTT